MPRTTPSAKYQGSMSSAHRAARSLASATPSHSARSGAPLIASSDPPGRAGASQSSHDISRSASAASAAAAARRQRSSADSNEFEKLEPGALIDELGQHH